MMFWGLQVSSTEQVQPQAVKQPSSQYSAYIRHIKCQCGNDGDPCTEIAISGTGFGAVREIHSGNFRRTRVVVIDGKAMTDPMEYYGWGDGHIYCDIDDFVPIVVNHVYKFAIGEIVQLLSDPKNQNLVVISPEFTFRYLIIWMPNSPPQTGYHGDVIQEIACGVMPPQGDQALMMGSTQVNNVISWGNPPGYLIFQVPNIPAGTYNLYIKKGVEVLSAYKAFTVK